MDAGSLDTIGKSSIGTRNGHGRQTFQVCAALALSADVAGPNDTALERLRVRA